MFPCCPSPYGLLGTCHSSKSRQVPILLISKRSSRRKWPELSRQRHSIQTLDDARHVMQQRFANSTDHDPPLAWLPSTRIS